MCANLPAEKKGAKLGILVLSKQRMRHLKSISRLAQAAAEQGMQVEIFLMGDGVLHLGEPCLEQAIQKGAKVSFCALNAMQRNLDQHPQYPWGANESSQYELACIVESSDRFLAFT